MKNFFISAVKTGLNPEEVLPRAALRNHSLSLGCHSEGTESSSCSPREWATNTGANWEAKLELYI